MWAATEYGSQAGGLPAEAPRRGRANADTRRAELEGQSPGIHAVRGQRMKRRQVDGRYRLPEIKGQAVQADCETREPSHMSNRCGDRLAASDIQSERAVRDADCEEGELFEPDRTRSRQSSQRINVQTQQDQRQRYRYFFGKDRQNEAGEGGPIILSPRGLP